MMGISLPADELVFEFGDVKLSLVILVILSYA